MGEQKEIDADELLSDLKAFAEKIADYRGRNGRDALRSIHYGVALDALDSAYQTKLGSAKIDALPRPALNKHYNAEIARIWMTGDDPDELSPVMVVRAGCFSNPEDPARGPAMWGILLADLARHIARGLHHGEADLGLALSQIQALFNCEIADPSATTNTRTLNKDGSVGRDGH